MEFSAEAALKELYLIKSENGDINELFDFFVDSDVNKLLDYLYEHKEERELLKSNYESSHYGQRYKVIHDTHGFFESGEFVIALENDDDNPFCVKESLFFDGATEYNYGPKECRALTIGVDIIPVIDKRQKEVQNNFISR